MERPNFKLNLGDAPTNNFHMPSIYDSPELQNLRTPLRKIAPEEASFVRYLGSGGGGDVNLVQMKDGSLMACKTVRLNTTDLKFIIREIEILCKTESPFVVSFYGLFQDDIRRLVELYMEYMDFGSLKTVRQTFGRMDETCVTYVAYCVLKALDFLVLILHRDLKPDNILVDNNGHVKLADFGCARKVPRLSYLAPTNIGLFMYMSPERLENENKAQMGEDQWSLGATIYELFTGHHPIPLPSLHCEVAMHTYYKRFEQTHTSLPFAYDFYACNPSADFKKFLSDCLRFKGKQRPAHFALLQYPCIAAAAHNKEYLKNWLNTAKLRTDSTSVFELPSGLLGNAFYVFDNKNFVMYDIISSTWKRLLNPPKSLASVVQACVSNNKLYVLTGVPLRSEGVQIRPGSRLSSIILTLISSFFIDTKESVFDLETGRWSGSEKTIEEFYTATSETTRVGYVQLWEDTSTCVSSGRDAVYVAGGPLNERIMVFDLTTGTSRFVPFAQSEARWRGRSHMALTLLGHDLYLIGGSICSGIPVNDVDVVDVRTGVARQGLRLPHGIYSAHATTIGDNLICVIGGVDDYKQPNTGTSTVLCMDITATEKKWSTNEIVPDMPEKFADFVFVRV